LKAASYLVKMTKEDKWKQIGGYLMGKALELDKKVPEAMAAFRQSLTFDARTREGAEASLHLGEMFASAENFSEAKTYLEKASEWSAESELADIRARSFFSLGDLAMKQKVYEEAARYYLGVAILFDDPDLTPKSLFEAANAFGLSRKPIEQRRTISELLERYPDSEWAMKFKKPKPSPKTDEVSQTGRK